MCIIDHWMTFKDHLEVGTNLSQVEYQVCK